MLGYLFSILCVRAVRTLVGTGLVCAILYDQLVFLHQIYSMLSTFLQAIIARGWLLLIRNITKEVSPIATELPWHIQLKVFEYISREDRKNFTTAFPWWQELVKSYERKLPEHTLEEDEQSMTLTDEFNQKIAKRKELVELVVNPYVYFLLGYIITIPATHFIPGLHNFTSIAISIPLFVHTTSEFLMRLTVLLWYVKYSRQLITFESLSSYIFWPVTLLLSGCPMLLCLSHMCNYGMFLPKFELFCVFFMDFVTIFFTQITASFI